MKLSTAILFSSVGAFAAAESVVERELHQKHPWHGPKPTIPKVHGKVNAKHINEALEVGQGKVIFAKGPFEVKARCVRIPESPFLPDPINPFRRNVIQLEVTATAMEEDLLVYGTGYTVFPGFISNRAIDLVEKGTDIETLLFRVDNIFPLPPFYNEGRGQLGSNPFNGGFSSSNGYHVAVDGDSCIGLVSEEPLDPEDEDLLSKYFGEGTDCAISCILQYAEPKETPKHAW